jgi:riboflavin kinase / FMN adenylyltransferase
LKIIEWSQFLDEARPLPLAAAIGVFDGMHLGHRALVQRILGRKGLASAVMTFKENPKRILSPSSFHGDLSTLGQKLELVESLGADFCVLIDFSGDFSKLPGRLFLSMLEKKAGLRYLAVGHDFRCGSGLDTDAEAIRVFCEERSIGVEFLRAVSWSGHPISSSRIRKAVLEGRLEDAATMLGRPYELDLRAVQPVVPDGVRFKASQAVPQGGMYEASLVAPGGIEPVSVLFDDEGSFSMAAGIMLGGRGPGEPIGLRLLRSVSRV